MLGFGLETEIFFDSKNDFSNMRVQQNN